MRAPAVFACLLVLAACSSGDHKASSGSASSPAASIVVTNAGADQTVPVGTMVILQAGTTGSDSDALHYQWSFASRPDESSAAILGDSPRADFVADISGRYVVVLVVNDGSHDSAPSEVVITAVPSTGHPPGSNPPAAASSGPCEPRLDAAKDALLFVWRDDDDVWHIRGLAGGTAERRYTGSVSSTAGFDTIGDASNPLVKDLTGTNSHVTAGTNEISFDLDVPALSQGGFAFKPDAGAATVTFALTASTGNGIRLGPLRTPVSRSFRLDHTGACGAPVVAGQSGTALPAGSLALWREDLGSGAKDRWHLGVSAAGTGTPTKFSGQIESDQAFATVAADGLGNGDTLDTSDQARIAFGLTPGPSPAGFDFDIAKGAHPCLTLGQPASARVLVGPNMIPLVPPFDLGTLGECPASPDAKNGVYNYVVVLTDDQRWDTLNDQVMPLLRARLQSLGGIQFTNAYLTTPLCCPARSTIHSGGLFAHRTGYLENTGPNGNVDLFRDDRTVARLLHDRGYSTFFVGKYFVTYSDQRYQHSWPYVPPGWTKFIGRNSWGDGTEPNTDGWNDFRFTVGSSREVSSVGTVVQAGEYTTDYERDQVLGFIDQAKDRPFYIFLATTAPHPPAIAASADIGKFKDFVYDSPSLNEDLSDKPAWVAQWPSKQKDEIYLSPQFIPRQLDSLQSVDRAVAAILDKLQARGLLDRTIFIFTSDNGYMWGEHGLWGKGVYYEESERVPLAIIAPQTPNLREDHSLLAANLDVPATVVDFAGLDLTGGGTRLGTDGISLRPFLEQPGMAHGRDTLFLESFGNWLGSYGLWAGVVQHKGEEWWKYIEHPNGDEELYDLVGDPHELESLQAQSAYSAKKAELKALVDSQKGLAITTFYQAIPRGFVNQPYEVELSAWGGVPPYNYHWSVDPAHPLPDGLTLSPSPLDMNKAVISGIPQKMVCQQPVWITVEDVQEKSANQPWETEHDRGQRFTNDTYRLTVVSKDDKGVITNPCQTQ